MVAVVDGSASIVFDERAWPIVWATWFGEPTETLVERYFECQQRIIERARRDRVRYVLITDTFATERPSPKVRKLIVDRTAVLPPEHTLKSYIVVESALIRGVVTALAWVYPAMGQSETVSSPAVACERALTDLDAAGIARPRVLAAAGYRRPARP